MASNDTTPHSNLVLPLSLKEGCLTSAFLSMGFILWLEVALLLLLTVKRNKSLYYRALISANIGLLFWILGIMLSNLLQLNPWIGMSFAVPGYLIFVPSELAILYSRLHVVGASSRLLLYVRIVCTLEVIFITIPTAVIGFGVRVATYTVPAFIPAADTMYKIECCIWSFVNTLIAGIYLVLLLKNWSRDSKEPGVRRLFAHLVASTVVLALVMASWIAISFSGALETLEPIMCLVFGLSLAVEFTMVQMLRELVRSKRKNDGRSAAYLSGASGFSVHQTRPLEPESGQEKHRKTMSSDMELRDILNEPGLEAGMEDVYVSPSGQILARSGRRSSR
ncbi:hypothetical protein BT63DRAFT_264995 [Microthyrium microscopicum]|uniref:Integral membrane protein n=1 Tax=Microthyrium microscopicum TaxID=703497 RepID=A0A6A6UCM5_9PEZI|nr:hypothetical protein BT63DRAFT_264995 [Microthyrium microscopicum]